LEALGINLGYLLVQILNFGILFVVLRAWVYKPIIKLLSDRRENIAKGLEDARVAAEARANAEGEAEKIIAEAQAKAAEIIHEATARSEEAALDIKAAADNEIAETRKNALADIEREHQIILSEVRGQIAALSMAATQKLIGEALDTKRQRALIDEFFSGVKAGKVIVVEPAKGDSAIITSALPLTQGEQDTIKKSVLGGKGKINFEVDPSILGGLVVRVGDKVLDGSVAGKLEAMRQSLK
jgi:F-type H+-transporting ATPase subunit b